MTAPWALVTGASRGIGAAIATELAAAGHPVIVNYRNSSEAAEAVKKNIEAAGGRAELARFDVANADETKRALAALLSETSEVSGASERPIGIVVNNAGVSNDAAFPAMTSEQWDEVLHTSLDGFFNVTRPLVMPMVRRRWGRIVVITSVSGIVGNRGQVNYAAAKAGLSGAVKSLARELAKRNITVNAVAPGLIESDMTASLPRDELLKHIPARRFGRPEEVSKLVRFLVSDDAAYITGQEISINGGLA